MVVVLAMSFKTACLARGRPEILCFTSTQLNYLIIHTGMYWRVIKHRCHSTWIGTRSNPSIFPPISYYYPPKSPPSSHFTGTQQDVTQLLFRGRKHVRVASYVSIGRSLLPFFHFQHPPPHYTSITLLELAIYFCPLRERTHYPLRGRGVTSVSRSQVVSWNAPSSTPTFTKKFARSGWHGLTTFQKVYVQYLRQSTIGAYFRSRGIDD